MLQRTPRLLRFALLSVASLGLVAAPLAQTLAKAKPAASAAPKAEAPWLYKGSDIPVDRNWTFGVLSNGVRYAVRRSGVPPRQVSIRVAIDAGSLMESDSELGFAHYLEHLSFRGSRYVPDGEAKRVWQRLGATFGSDSNAQTTPTQTVYKLDLPNATPEGLAESMKILSGMMASPNITDAPVNAERRTVLAEAREQFGPQVRAGDATREIFFSGQLLAKRSPIGTVTSLNAATAAGLKAFHDRWYRPERMIIAISGDADPATLETLVKTHFADWKVAGLPVPDPNFGLPDPKAPTSKVLVEPGLPLVISLATLRPWVLKNDTIVYNQAKLLDFVALRIINRRLETRARAGGSFIQAQVAKDDVSRTVDGTFVSIVPIGSDWQAALTDVRAVIADALVNAPSKAAVDREVAESISGFDAAVETERAEAAAKQADDIIEAVNIRETVATAAVARDVFTGLKDRITPDDILKATQRIFVGVGPRALLSSPVAVADGERKLAAAINAPVKALASAVDQGAVGFDRLPKLGAPAKTVKVTEIPNLDTQIVELSNGVRLLIYSNTAEAGRVYVTARFGRGFTALPSDKVTPAWAASSALVASGVGDLGQDELDRLTSGRRINLDFSTGEDAFYLRGVTKSSDLKDQMHLIAAKLLKPKWDAAPVARARAEALISIQTIDSGPQSVIGASLGELLHGGDKRWATPNAAEINALTPEKFRAFWEPLLATGPLEVSIFGDVGTQEAIAAAQATFGALPPRTAAPISAARAKASGPIPNTKPLVKTHKGPADQAAAILSWATSGGLDNLYDSRKLDVLANIFTDRLFEQFREAEGASYSPNVGSDWPNGLSSGGSFTVLSQIKPDNANRFFVLSKQIAAELASKPVTADELQRAVGPMIQQINRASSGNTFWMTQLSGASTDPRRIDAVRSIQFDLGRITPAELQETAKRYLIPGKSFSMVVVPEKKK